MRRIISPAQMRDCERACFESGKADSLVMMENAASALCAQAMTMVSGGSKVYIACGPGGNGGDGYACARMLRECGCEVVVYGCGEPRHKDAVINRDRLVRNDFVIDDAGLPSSAPDLWIDCLYGTGLSRCPQGRAADMITRMNEDRARGCRTLAADIASGLNGTNGTSYEICVQADVTLSFQFAKYGHFLRDGLDVSGQVLTADIGFPDGCFGTGDCFVCDAETALRVLPARRRNLHKGNCGHLLIVAGSRGMTGAAALCAGAALRSGAGLVSIACPESIMPVLQTLEPCAMCVPLPETPEGCLSEDAAAELRRVMSGKSAIACGCGWSRRVSPSVLEAILESGLPTVIDADALNILSEHPELRNCLTDRHVLTPHPGEAARLLGHAIEDPISDANALAQTGAVALLKGASSVIADGGTTRVCTAGSSSMARGGSGDILAGILGALLADRSALHRPSDAALIACALHGLAGEIVEARFGRYAAKASDQIDALAEVFVRHGL